MRRSPTGRLAIVAATVVAIVVASLVVRLAAGGGALRAAPAIRIAVIDFQGAGAVGEYASLGAGLQSMLTTDLAAAHSIAVVERTKLAQLRGELKLSRSAAADPTTALRVGKLAGATHLVTGTFTIVGNELRLDARAIDVATGRVVLATDARGERDTFFELEKKLAGAIVAGIGVTLNPKERASFARIQTADWEAFRRFGDGLRLFDDADYDRSLEALRDATARDQEFGLARTTLDTYQRLASEIRGRAAVLEAETRMKSVEARRQLHTEEQAIVDRLLAVAARRGAAARAARVAAIYLAITILTDGMDDEGLDRFARERMRDALVTRYVHEADGLFPDLPIVPFQPMGERFGGPPPPRSPAEVDRAVAAAIDRFARYGENPARDAKEIRGYKEEHLTSIFGRTFEQTALAMHLDYRAATELMDRFYTVGARFSPDGPWRRNALTERARRRRRLLDLDASTRLFKEAAGAESDPGALRGLAKEIEANAAIAGLLASAHPDPCLREWTRSAIEQDADSVGPRMARESKRSELCAADIVRWDRRKVLRGDLLDTLPIWLFQAQSQSPLSTGPRTEPGRVSDLRYLGRSSDRDWLLAIVEGVPRVGAELTVDLTFDLPPDAPCRPGYDCPGAAERPTLTFFFDAANVLVRGSRHNGLRDDVPMEATGVAIGDGSARSVDLRVLLASERMGATGPVGASKATTAARARTPLALPAAGHVAITIRREDRRLVLEVPGQGAAGQNPAKQQLTFDAPPASAGFLGILVSGGGFVGIGGVRVRPLPR